MAFRNVDDSESLTARQKQVEDIFGNEETCCTVIDGSVCKRRCMVKLFEKHDSAQSIVSECMCYLG